jgi:hypothetical protein
VVDALVGHGGRSVGGAWAFDVLHLGCWLLKLGAGRCRNRKRLGKPGGTDCIIARRTWLALRLGWWKSGCWLLVAGCFIHRGC